MKQFIVFIHSKFSKASLQCESIINNLPSELNINYLSIDNPKTRKIILQDSQLEIKIVPTILVVDIKGKVSKFEGKTCFEYLSQFQPPPPPVNIRPFQEEIIKPQPPPPPPQQKPQPQPASPVVVQKSQPKKPKKPLPPMDEPINFDEEHFNSQPANNITSLDDDDDDDGENDIMNVEEIKPPPPKKQQRPPSPQHHPPPQKNNSKPNILAHAQAMQKSRLQDDDFNKKNH